MQLKYLKVIRANMFLFVNKCAYLPPTSKSLSTLPLRKNAPEMIAELTS